MIDIEKFSQFDDVLNEMAFKDPRTNKIYQKGDIVKAYFMDSDTTSKGSIFGVTIAKDTDRSDGLFYFSVTNNSTKYISGTILFVNCGISNNFDESFRMNGKNGGIPGEEWKYIEPKIDELKSLNGKRWFCHGDEEVFMDIEGNQTSAEERNYVFNGDSINFKLTKKFKEPVLCIHIEKDRRKIVCVKLSSLSTLSTTLSKVQNETIADWFIENTGLEVKYDESYKAFKIPKYFIRFNDSDRIFPSKQEIGPFISKKQAEKVLEALKDSKVNIYDVNKATIENNGLTYYESCVFDLTTLINFMKANGVKFNMRDLLKGKEGEAALKNLNF